MSACAATVSSCCNASLAQLSRTSFPLSLPSCLGAVWDTLLSPLLLHTEWERFFCLRLLDCCGGGLTCSTSFLLAAAAVDSLQHGPRGIYVRSEGEGKDICFCSIFLCSLCRRLHDTSSGICLWCMETNAHVAICTEDATLELPLANNHST